MAQRFNLLFCFNLLSLTLLCMSVVSSTSAGKNQSSGIGKGVQPRIVGGVLTTTQKISYMVNIREHTYYFCGGSLISTLHVLTAAHCLKGKDKSTLTVYTGTYLNENEFWRNVAKMWVYPNFSFKIMANDVAVIKMDAPISELYAKPIALCSNGLKVGQVVQISGWGFTNPNTFKVSNQLRTVNVTFIKKSKCKKKYRRRIKLKKSMICASASGRDACTGDSGGPLVVNGITPQQCGIVSFGVGCARPDFPGVYTSVLRMKAWILNCMQL